MTSTIHRNEVDGQDMIDNAKIAKAYDSEPWWYDIRGFLILTFAYRSTLWSQIRLFAHNISSKHLEVAIGSGTLFDICLKWLKVTRRGLPQEVYGFDYAEPMLRGAIRRFRKYNFRLEIADVAKLPYADNFFNSANIANAIHCFPDAQSGLAEVARVLGKGGTLAGNALLVPRGTRLSRYIANRINAWGQRKGIVNRPFTVEEIREKILKTGLTITVETVEGNTYNFIAKKIDI